MASLAGSFSLAVYSDRDHNLLICFGAEYSALSENPLKTLRIRGDFRRSQTTEDAANGLESMVNMSSDDAQ
jgi:hypothetical protein